MIAVASGFSTAHAVLTPSAQPHVPTLSGATVSLCPRICLHIPVQLVVLNALKAVLALEDQLVQHPHACIQIRMPDPSERSGSSSRLRHLPGGRLQLVEEHSREVEPAAVKRTLVGVERVWRAISAGNFYPAPSTMSCAGCGYRAACRVWMG